MTGSSSPVRGSVAPLGPFQRGSVSAPPHVLAVTTDKASGAAVFGAAVSVLEATPNLCAELVSVSSMRTPWQRLAQVHSQSLSGDAIWEISAGATTLRVTEETGRCRLTVSVPPVFADARSLVRLVDLIDQLLQGRSPLQ